MQKSNPWALRGIAERLLEAADRGLWAEPDAKTIDQLQQVYLDLEGDIEAGKLYNQRSAELARADHFVVEFLAGQLEAQAQVRVFRPVLALIQDVMRRWWPRAERFRLQLLNRETGRTRGPVIGAEDSAARGNCATDRARYPDRTRPCMSSDQLVAVEDETRPDLLRWDHVCLSQRP